MAYGVQVCSPRVLQQSHQPRVAQVWWFIGAADSGRRGRMSNVANERCGYLCRSFASL